MKTEFLTPDNLNDAKEVIRNRFDESCCDLLEKELRNPALKLYPESGEIVYGDDGKPIAFQANIPRRIFLGQKEFVGMVGGLTCLKKNSPPEAFIDLRAASNYHFKNGIMIFSNTSCKEMAATHARLLKKKNTLACNSIPSYARLRIGLIHPLRMAFNIIQNKIMRNVRRGFLTFTTLDSKDFSVMRKTVTFERYMTFPEDFFDRLMKAYLRKNKGLLCSRSAEELRWVFQETVSSGQSILICASENDIPLGYIIVKINFARCRCQIVDWFALENDLWLLESLVQVMKRYLRQHTPLLAIETFGFPTFVQPIISRHFPIERKLGHNMFAWRVKRELRDEILKMADTTDSWFFGPYDGDGCM